MHESVELVVIEIWVLLKILEAIFKRIGVEPGFRIGDRAEKEDDEEESESHPDDGEVFVLIIGFGEVANEIGKESERP